MADTVPQLQQQIRIQPAAVPNVEAGGDAMAAVFGNASRQLFGEVKKQETFDAIKKGKEAGGKLNFKPDPHPFGDVSRTFQQAALIANQAMIQETIRDKTRTLRHDVLMPGNFSSDSLAQYRAGSDGILEGIIGQIPEANKAYAKTIWNTYNGNNERVVQDQVDTLNQHVSTAGIHLYIHDNYTDATNSAFAGNFDDANAHIANTLQKLNWAFAGGQISEAYFTAQKEALNKGTTEAKFLGEMQRKILTGSAEDVAKFRADVEKQKIPQLDSFEKQQMMAKMDSQIREHNTFQKGMLSALKNKEDNAVAEITTAGTHPKDYADLLATASGIDAKAGANLQVRMELAEMQHGITKRLSFASPAQAGIIIKEAAPRVGDKLFKKKEILQKNALTFYKSIRVNQLKNAGEMFLHSPAVVAAARQEKLEATVPFKPGLSQKTDKYAVMINQEKIAALPEKDYSVTPRVDAQNTVGQLNAMSFSNRIKALNEYLPQFQSQQAIALRDLKNAGLGLSDQMALHAINDPLNGAYVGQIEDAFSTPLIDLQDLVKTHDDYKDLDTEVASNLEHYDQTTNKYNGLTSTTLASTRKNVRRLALKFMQDSNESAASAAKNAADVLVNNSYEYATYNGISYRAPKGFDLSLTRDAIKVLVQRASKMDLTIPSGYGKNLSEDERKIAYIRDVSNSGGAITNTLDNGLELVDENGNPVKDSNGVLIATSFDKLSNPMSDIRQATSAIDLRRSISDQNVDPFLAQERRDKLKKLKEAGF